MKVKNIRWQLNSDVSGSQTIAVDEGHTLSLCRMLNSDEGRQTELYKESEEAEK